MVYQSDSPPRCPVPVRHLHAIDDTTVLYDGAVADSPNTLAYAPVETVLGNWATQFGCAASPVVASAQSDYAVLMWKCPGGAPAIELYRANRGGHQWLRADNSGLVATDAIWEFFQAHPKP